MKRESNKDRTGCVYGYLTVLRKADRGSRWLCICVCGAQKEVFYSHLKNCSTRSCGCKRPGWISAVSKKHGMLHSLEYRRWQGMLQRCYYDKHISFAYYGGRGIRVCPQWRRDFSQFYSDMGPCPDGHTIEREDVNGNYCPENCLWLPAKLQGSNKTNNILIEHRGQRKTLSQWARECGISPQTIWYRHQHGDTGDLLFRPVPVFTKQSI